ncbi:MAG: hypothetical protein IT539_11980 [Bradyrhizobiaceae bacterium]|nr:hypothetical protein [Bradyrhizobiaceae bacterium]
MPIRSLLERGGFTPEMTQALANAFEKAWHEFKSSGHPLADASCEAATRALLAKRIIETARTGEQRTDRLAKDGISYLAQLN